MVHKMQTEKASTPGTLKSKRGQKRNPLARVSSFWVPSEQETSDGALVRKRKSQELELYELKNNKNIRVQEVSEHLTMEDFES